MVHLTPFLTLAITAGLITQSTAHPGEHHDTLSVQQEIAKRTTHANHIARGLNNCAGNEKYHALQARASERRLQKAQNLRRKRELPVDGKFDFLLVREATPANKTCNSAFQSPPRPHRPGDFRDR